MRGKSNCRKYIQKQLPLQQYHPPATQKDCTIQHSRKWNVRNKKKLYRRLLTESQ